MMQMTLDILPREEAINSRRHETERQAQEARERDGDCKSRQRNQADLEWMRRINWLEFHQLTDRIRHGAACQRETPATMAQPVAAESLAIRRKLPLSGGSSI
jgi:hypothetical protein